MFNHMPVQQAKKQPSIIDLANATYSMKASSSSQQSSLLQRQQNNTSNGSGISNSSKGRSIIKNGNRGSRSFSSMSSTTKNSLDDRLDAARAMLGISPCSVIDESVTTIMGGRGGPGDKNNNNNNNKSSLLQKEDQEVEEEASMVITTTTYDDPNSSGRSRSNSAGLDALAFYATREQEATIASTTVTMPSILLEGNSDLNSSDFGRFIGGHNSDNQISSSSHKNNNNEAAAAATTVVVPPNPVTSSSDDDSETMPPPPPRTTYINTNNNTRMSRRRSVSNPEIMDKWDTKRLRLVLPASILEEEIAEAEAAILIAKKEKSLATTTEGGGSSCNNDDEEDEDDDGDDESDSLSSPPTMVDEEEENLDHDQLLRRARSRLLEDLSIASGEKGVLTLPHSLKKYKEVRTVRLCTSDLPTYLLCVRTFVL
jgi:hypothetical protein